MIYKYWKMKNYLVLKANLQKVKDEKLQFR